MTEPEATERALVESLIEEGHAAEKIHVETNACALDAMCIHTRVDDAYPGVGLRTALVLDGRRYGLGARDLADLARARRWHEPHLEPSALEDLAAIVAFAWLPQMVCDSEAVPTLSRDGETLVLTFVAREVSSGKRLRVDAHVPRVGLAQLKLTSDASPPPEVPADPVAALEQALATGDALATMAALQRMDSAPAGLVRTRALARAAVMVNEAIAFGALMKLEPNEASAAALREAIKGLDDPQALPRLVERARMAWGEAFASRLNTP